MAFTPTNISVFSRARWRARSSDFSVEGWRWLIHLWLNGLLDEDGAILEKKKKWIILNG